MKYSGTTVFLDADLNFSGRTLAPVGSFQGAFDGQGHIISNLAMNSSSEFVGLFGYSIGATIRNVVLDSSCSINSYNADNTYIGGIVGECYNFCFIENNTWEEGADRRGD